MSGAKCCKVSSNSHNPIVVGKLLIIHSIYGNAAKCLWFYGLLPVWCALNRNKYSEEQGKLGWFLKTAKSVPKKKQRMALSIASRMALHNSKVYSCCV